MSDLQMGVYLPDGDVELHPRSTLGDQFILLPLGYAHIALASPHPTRATCVDILNHRNDQRLVVSRLGSVDEADAKPGDWVCVRENVNQQAIAAFDIGSLTNGIPGSLDLGITTW